MPETQEIKTAVSILVNGTEHEVPGDSTVRSLLVEMRLNVDAGGIAVAVNDSIVRKSDWDDRLLAPSDRVEVVTATQGG